MRKVLMCSRVVSNFLRGLRSRAVFYFPPVTIITTITIITGTGTSCTYILVKEKKKEEQEGPSTMCEAARFWWGDCDYCDCDYCYGGKTKTNPTS